MYFLQSASPFCDAMTGLLYFSKEGEIDVAHKILDRLMALTYKICEFSSPRAETNPHSPKMQVGSGKSFRSEKLGALRTSVTAHVSGSGVTASGGKERTMLRLEQSVHVSGSHGLSG